MDGSRPTPAGGERQVSGIASNFQMSDPRHQVSDTDARSVDFRRPPLNHEQHVGAQASIASPSFVAVRRVGTSRMTGRIIA